MAKYKLVKKIENKSGDTRELPTLHNVVQSDRKTNLEPIQNIFGGGVYTMYSPLEDTIQVASPMLPTISPTLMSYPTPNIMGPKIKLHNTIPLSPYGVRVASPQIPIIPTSKYIYNPYGCSKPKYQDVQCSRNIPSISVPQPCAKTMKRNCDTNIVDIFMERFKGVPLVDSPLSDDLPPTLSQ